MSVIQNILLKKRFLAIYENYKPYFALGGSKKKKQVHKKKSKKSRKTKN